MALASGNFRRSRDLININASNGGAQSPTARSGHLTPEQELGSRLDALCIYPG